LSSRVSPKYCPTPFIQSTIIAPWVSRQENDIRARKSTRSVWNASIFAKSTSTSSTVYRSGTESLDLYANRKDHGEDADEINAERHNLLGQQLKVYDKYQISWSIRLYKDIGLQGMLHTSPDSAWIKLLGPWLEKKQRLQLDIWGRKESPEVDSVIHPLIEWVTKVSEGAKMLYPFIWGVDRHIERAVLETFLSDSLQGEFAELFRGKSFEELDALAKSFSFENYVQREGLNKIMAEYAKLLRSD
jgi:hypothetical protein